MPAWCPSDTRGLLIRGTQKVVGQMRLLRSLGAVLGAAALVLAAGCSNSSNSLGGSGDKGSLVIGGQDFTESQVLASMYDQVLTKAGYSVQQKLVTTRDVYLPELSNGGVDVVPDYLSGLTDYLSTAKNGPNSTLISSHSSQATLTALKPLAAAKGISMLEPAKASDANAFFVTTGFAASHHLQTLSDLAAMHQPLKLGADSDCSTRSDCALGLKSVYGINVQVVPLGFGTTATKNAVKSGETQLGESGTTDGSLKALGLVILQDDKGMQHAQNLIPAVNSGFLKAHPDVAPLLNKLSSTLTTADLTALNLKVDADRQKPEDVAKAYLQDKGLL